MVAFSKRKLKNFVQEQLKEYKATLGAITAEELELLNDWTAKPNSPFVNPWFLCEENGQPFDFISAFRIITDMRDNPSDYLPNADSPNAANEYEIPF